MSSKVNKVGRPALVNWSQFNLMWRNCTNKEVSLKAGCSVVNVFLKRKKLIEKAKAEGKNPLFYTCSKKPWTHAKKVKKVELVTVGEPGILTNVEEIGTLVVAGEQEKTVVANI